MWKPEMPYHIPDLTGNMEILKEKKTPRTSESETLG